ncbi:MAG: hypothetical protein JSR66_19945 [Proteobacteria bacterium]|nr:hypothetical protein [Pseudomonadota bacterium]
MSVNSSRIRLPLAVATALAAPLSAAMADVTLPPVTIGAGLRTSFAQTRYDDGVHSNSSDFSLDSARIYLNGTVTDDIKFMFNTEYNGSSKDVDIIDAAAMFSFGDKVNIWAGRFLPPSDRANLYGPYYASNWGTFRDGVQDGYPFEAAGRDNGVLYWGQFGILKVSAGAFGQPGLPKGSSDVLWAGRAQLDFWDPETGYYLNGTYYGDKDVLAVGVAAQNSAGKNAASADFLLEKKLGNAGVVTVESEYARYDRLGGYPAPGAAASTESHGWYLLGAYLLPQPVGMGKVQFLGKYGETRFSIVSGEIKEPTTELDLNYLIKGFNARVTLFFINQEYDHFAPDMRQVGMGLQVQM